VPPPRLMATVEPGMVVWASCWACSALRLRARSSTTTPTCRIGPRRAIRAACRAGASRSATRARSPRCWPLPFVRAAELRRPSSRRPRSTRSSRSRVLHAQRPRRPRSVLRGRARGAVGPPRARILALPDLRRFLGRLLHLRGRGEHGHRLLGHLRRRPSASRWSA
jgi:hypothetical protein